MAPPPAVAVATAPAPPAHEDHAEKIARAVDLLLQSLQASRGDRIVLETNHVPMLIAGPRKCAMMVGRLPLSAIQMIAAYLFPPEHLEALEEIGGTRFGWPGFKAVAQYEGQDLTIEILCVRSRTGM
jgi:hypothetical protein